MASVLELAGQAFRKRKTADEIAPLRDQIIAGLQRAQAAADECASAEPSPLDSTAAERAEFSARLSRLRGEQLTWERGLADFDTRLAALRAAELRQALEVRHAELVKRRENGVRWLLTEYPRLAWPLSEGMRECGAVDQDAEALARDAERAGVVLDPIPPVHAGGHPERRLGELRRLWEPDELNLPGLYRRTPGLNFWPRRTDVTFADLTREPDASWPSPAPVAPPEEPLPPLVVEELPDGSTGRVVW